MKPKDGIGQRGGVPRWDQDSRPPIFQDLRWSSPTRRHDGETMKHPFEHDHAERFVATGEDQHVGPSVFAPHVLRGEPSGEADATRVTPKRRHRPRRRLFDAHAGPAAHQDEPHVVGRFEDQGNRGQEIVQTLAAHEPSRIEHRCQRARRSSQRPNVRNVLHAVAGHGHPALGLRAEARDAISLAPARGDHDVRLFDRRLLELPLVQERRSLGFELILEHVQ